MAKQKYMSAYLHKDRQLIWFSMVSKSYFLTVFSSSLIVNILVFASFPGPVQPQSQLIFGKNKTLCQIKFRQKIVQFS